MKTTKDILGNCISLTEDALETQLREDPFEALYQIKEKLESIKKIDLNIYSCEDLATLKGNVGKLVEAQTKLVKYRSDYILEKSNLISEIKELLK